MSDNSLQYDFDDELLSAYLDDELAPDQRALVEARLASDPAARQTLEQLRHISQTVRGLPNEPLGRDLRDSILRRAEEAKRAAEPPTPAAAPAPPPRFTIGRTKRGWLWASLAVAAALLIMFSQGDALKDNNGTSVAQRRREPASRTAPPAPAGLASSEPDARSALETDTAPPMASGEASRVGRPESARRFAAAPSEPIGTIDEDELVVVHVLAKREALENKVFDQLLLSNGIAVEPEAAAERGLASADGVRTLSSSNRTATRAAAHPADEPSNLDVVLVEAPPNKILSFVADLNQDYANYLGVSVDDPVLADDAEALQAARAKKLATDLDKYSRGNVPQRQKELLDRDKAYYYQQAQSPDAHYEGGTGGAIEAAGGRQLEEGRMQRTNDKNEGRAQRVRLPNTDDPRAVELRSLGRELKAPAKGEPDNLQVLFVLVPSDLAPSDLAPGDESATSLPAENSPE